MSLMSYKVRKNRYSAGDTLLVASFLSYLFFAVCYGAGVYFSISATEKFADVIVQFSDIYLTRFPMAVGFVAGPLPASLYTALTLISGFFSYFWLFFIFIKSSIKFIESPLALSRQFLKRNNIENKLPEIIKYRVVFFTSFTLSLAMFLMLVGGNIHTVHEEFVTAIIFVFAAAVAGPVVPLMLFLNASFFCHDIKSIGSFISKTKGDK